MFSVKTETLQRSLFTLLRETPTLTTGGVLLIQLMLRCSDQSEQSVLMQLTSPCHTMCWKRMSITCFFTIHSHSQSLPIQQRYSLKGLSMLYLLRMRLSSPVAPHYSRQQPQCTVDIPYSTDSQLALVITNIPENTDWGENVEIDISCSRRNWAYALVTLLPLLLIISVVVVVVASTCFYCYKHGSRN